MSKKGTGLLIIPFVALGSLFLLTATLHARLYLSQGVMEYLGGPSSDFF